MKTNENKAIVQHFSGRGTTAADVQSSRKPARLRLFEVDLDSMAQVANQGQGKLSARLITVERGTYIEGNK
jgi:hypothetical protein